MALTIIEPDTAGVIRKLAEIVEECADEAIRANEIFKIGLSGDYWDYCMIG